VSYGLASFYLPYICRTVDGAHARMQLVADRERCENNHDGSSLELFRVQSFSLKSRASFYHGLFERVESLMIS
jgi:hypothetical protein